MSDATSADNEVVMAAEFKGAVIVGAVPGAPARVMIEAVEQAKLRGVHLLVTHVDVTRFVTYEDPDGYVHSAPLDLDGAAGQRDGERVQAEAAVQLEHAGVPWKFQQLVGDPALAMKQLADAVDACVIVVGTRDRGIGESIREFFTGSVAARLAHRQRHPILVVPRTRTDTTPSAGEEPAKDAEPEA